MPTSSKEAVMLQTLRLKLEKFCITEVINMDCIDFAVIADYTANKLLVKLNRYILTDKKSGTTIKTPLTPLQFFKEKYLPSWLLKRYPVKYREVHVDFRVMYPDYRIQHSTVLGRGVIEVLET